MEQTVSSCGPANAAFFIRSRQHQIRFPISATFLRDREHSSYQIDWSVDESQRAL